MAEQNRKLKVGVIFGGRSGEHDVSLKSAESVMRALDRDKYDVVMIGISRDGEWIGGDALATLTDGTVSAEKTTFIAGATQSALMKIDADSRLSLSAELDVVIPILHGTYGEDGTVQGLLELANIPYVGAGVVGSAVGMDKAIFKHVMVSAGLPILPWQLILRSAWKHSPKQILDQLEEKLSYPMFTKPANLGSSVGIAKCTNRAELEAGMDEAATYDRRIVIEQGVNVRELEVAVLGNDFPIASVVGEVRPKRDFYDYVAKYISDDSDLIIPAELSDAQSDDVRALAVKAFAAIDCAGLGRVDFLLDTDTEKLYINEINTLPGFTNISMYPKLWEATGLSYAELLDKLIELAVRRFDDKTVSQTNFEVAVSSDK